MSRSTSIASSPLGRLPNGWTSARLKDITTKLGSGATPKGGENNYLRARERFALIRSQNVFDRRFDAAGLAFISDEQAGELRGAEVRLGDLLLNITGDGITFARACAVPEHVLPACVNQHVSIIRTDAKRCASQYLLCYLTHPAIKGYIESFNSGGSRRAITKGHIESFVVPLPPLTLQRAIACLLGALDAKIDLNRRMNETLERIARAIFKAWFVDLDPVRAKAEGQQPAGMDPQTAALFPNAFTDTQAGQIPNGWSAVNVGSVIEIKREGINPGEFAGETFDHYSIPAFDEGRMPRQESGEAIKSNKFIVPPQTVLLSKLNPRFPRVWLPELSSIRRAVCSTEFIVSEPKPGVSREFVYCLFGSSAFAESFTGLVTGTSSSHQRVMPEDLLHMKVIQPPPALVARFTELVGPMLKHNSVLTEQSLSLSCLRDALLPKLLSGELRIRDAEKMVEAHV